MKKNIKTRFVGFFLFPLNLIGCGAVSTPVVTGSATCSSTSQGSCSKTGYCIDFPSSATALAAQANACSSSTSTTGSGGGTMTYSSNSCATVNASATLVFSCLTNASNVNNAMLIRYYTNYTIPSGGGSTVSAAASGFCTTLGGTGC